LLAPCARRFHRSLDPSIDSSLAKNALDVRNSDSAAHVANDGFEPKAFRRVKSDDFLATLGADLLDLHAPARASTRGICRFCAAKHFLAAVLLQEFAFASAAPETVRAGIGAGE
jgi:hypothetical protein